MPAWAEWVRAEYVLDRTRQELVRLVLEADVRYQQARAALDREGLTQVVNGRVVARPEVAIELAARSAIAQLIAVLGLEEEPGDHTSQASGESNVREWPRQVR
jgi:hypothetical protein